VQFEGVDDSAVPAAAGPVFVDSSGRRGRRVRALFWTLGALMAAYVATVVLSLVGAPGLSRLAVPGVGPVLPGAGAPKLSTGGGRHERVAKVLTSPSSTSSAGRLGGGTPGPTASAAGATAAPTPAPSPTALTTAAPSPTPRRSPGTTGAPSPAPTTGTTTSPRATPPGQSTSRPTPHSTRGAHASPSPTP